VNTEIVAATSHGRRLSQGAPVSRAVELLRAGEIVALPTETVYGLAADALNPVAVAKIFEAKERPRFDPLIVHLPNYQWLERMTVIPIEHRGLVLKLAQKFWPGPFTLVLPRRDIVPEIVTAGLNTVAVRISAHPVLALILRQLDRPLAAPSANRFGRISPTSAQHVLEELGGRIPLIIDTGPTEHGLESTIVRVREESVEVLRSGPITVEQLSDAAQVQVVAAGHTKISAPGQLPSHYAPRTPLELIDDAQSFCPVTSQRVGLLAWKSSDGLRVANGLPNHAESKFRAIRYLSERQDLCEAAANLFGYLRDLDLLDLDLIVAERVPLQGIGAAIMDRLQRAARGRTHEQDRPE
jgi:L-threonylcarbamoyladenylate synthase